MMPVVKASPIAKQSYPLSTSNQFEQLIENPHDDSQARITFLPQLHIKTHHHHQRPSKTTNINKTSSSTSIPERRPSNLLELKQQRLVEAADRRKRIITRIISVVGLLIILLCAVIVALTLKMAPKIDELVRTKTGAHQLIHLMYRMSTSSTITIMDLNNFTTNNSLIEKSTFRIRRRI